VLTVTAAGSALSDALGLALGDAEELADRLGVPLHTHTPLAGAPQKTKQHSAGQGVDVTLGDTLTVGENCAQMQVNGATGAHTYVPAQPDVDADTDGDTGLCVKDGVSDELTVHEGDCDGDGCSDRDAVGDGDGEGDGDGDSDNEADTVCDRCGDGDGDAVSDGDVLGDVLGDAEVVGELDPSSWQQTGCKGRVANSEGYGKERQRRKSSIWGWGVLLDARVKLLGLPYISPLHLPR